MKPMLFLGCDGMGDYVTEDDFDSWVQYVCQHIDAKCRFEVDVDVLHAGDVQRDVIRADDTAKETIKEALSDLWNDWCRGGASA